MKYQLPSLKTYMMGLMVLIGITVLASLLLPTLGIDSKNVVLAVMVGLFVGHLIGTSLKSAPATVAVNNHDRQHNNNEITTLYVGNLAFHTSKYE
ncbi:MAG: hypothetical protein LJE85_14605, partial [Gammaproteobacteria bacterium]|nr:hypothetical protein [Gammaproteobacteria bacterium]